MKRRVIQGFSVDTPKGTDKYRVGDTPNFSDKFVKEYNLEAKGLIAPKTETEE